MFFKKKLKRRNKQNWIFDSNEYILVYIRYRYKTFGLALENIYKNMILVQ
jgi:hypothetical protein